MRRFIPLWILLVVHLCALSAYAQKTTITGTDDAAFRPLLGQWLAGQDQVALTGIAALANGDNLAAQVFMGVVTNGVAPHTSSHILLRIHGDKRAALTRVSGGEHAGKSWLDAARDFHPLAKAYLEYDTRNYQKSYDYLLSHNEWFLAYRAHAKYITDGGVLTALKAAEKGHYDAVSKPWLTAFVQRGDTLGLPAPSAKLRRAFDGVADAHFGAEREFFAWGRPDGARYNADTRSWADYPDAILRDPALHNRLRGMVVHDPRMAPVRQLCDRVCPNNSSSCGIALRAHVGSYDRFWNESRSPIEAIISTADYRKSARFVDDMRRLMASEPQTPSAVAPLSACFSDYMYGH